MHTKNNGRERRKRLFPTNVFQHTMASAEQKKAMKAAMAIAAAKEGECVRVVVRVRPLSRKETQDGRNQCCFVDEEACTVSVKNPKARQGASVYVHVRARVCACVCARTFFSGVCVGVCPTPLFFLSSFSCPRPMTENRQKCSHLTTRSSKRNNLFA